MKHSFYSVFAAIMILAMSFKSYAGGSVIVGGGGDPDAVAFIASGTEFVEELKAIGEKSFLSRASIEALERTLLDLELSLDGPSQAKLRFTEESLFDENHVQKWAIFDRRAQSIVVDRNRWATAADASRKILVRIELLGLIGDNHRYTDVLAAMPRQDSDEKAKRTYQVITVKVGRQNCDELGMMQKVLFSGATLQCTLKLRGPDLGEYHQIETRRDQYDARFIIDGYNSETRTYSLTILAFGDGAHALWKSNNLELDVGFVGMMSGER